MNSICIPLSICATLPLHFNLKSFKASHHWFKLSLSFTFFKFRIKDQSDFNGILQTVCSKSFFKSFSSLFCPLHSANHWFFCSLSAAAGITLPISKTLLPVCFSCLFSFQPRTTTAPEINQWPLLRSEHFGLYYVPNLRESQLETPNFSFPFFHSDLLMLILLTSILIFPLSWSRNKRHKITIFSELLDCLGCEARI